MTELNELQLVDRWLEVKEHNEGRAEGTIQKYRHYVLSLAAYLAERKMTLLTATAEAIEDFAGRHQHARKVKPNGRRVIVAAIRGFYRWLEQKRVLDENPAACLPTPKIGSPLPRSISLSHAERLLMEPGISTFGGLRDSAILAVLIGTGCRASGARALNESDLIWTHSRAGTERLTIRLREKGKKERLVPVPLECSLLIRAYLGHPAMDEIDRTLPNGDRALFVSQRNRHVPEHNFFGEARRISRTMLFWMMQRHGASAGIPKEFCHPHALRHLYGTELAEHDVDLLVRQALLGHSKPETTEIYSHLAMRKLTDTVDRANPLGKMPRGPTHGLAARLRKAMKTV